MLWQATVGVSTLLVALVVGLIAWSLAEYVLHRWAFHHRHHDRLRSLTAREHRMHHREPLRTSPMLRTLAWLGVVAIGSPVLLLGWPLGACLLSGWALGYTAYDQFHWRSHHRQATRRYETTLRNRHQLHHYGHPNRNYGVTTDLWDRAFGTRVG
ncbi:MAG: sterol desaturase family protein [Actinomycetota bacterium]|nr:sterol desaturase family protein [Actinomycetota bacterium]